MNSLTYLFQDNAQVYLIIKTSTYYYVYFFTWNFDIVLYRFQIKGTNKNKEHSTSKLFKTLDIWNTFT